MPVPNLVLKLELEVMFSCMVKQGRVVKEGIGRFLGAFDKYLEILCYVLELFERFGSIWKLFGAFLTNFENSTEVLCHFLKTT